MPPGHTEVEFNVPLQALFEDGPVGGLPDGVLLDRFLSRDRGGAERAFATLVARHGPMVLGVCRRVLADAHLAEDAFQATFLVLARRARSVRDRDALAGWLHRVARRIALRVSVQAKRRNDRERPDGREAVVEHADRAVAGELRAAIDEEVDRLRDAQRLPVVLCCLEGLSHEQAAAQLRWPVGTVKSRLARGRRVLQERLVRRGFAPSLAVATTALSVVEAEAAIIVPPALAAATTQLAAGAAAAAIPVAVSALVREELGSMIIAKSSLAGILVLAGGASAAFIGLGLAAVPPQESQPKATAGGSERATAQAPAETPAALSPSRTFTLRLVDPDGRSVAGASLYLRARDQFSNTPLGRSDNEGRYEVTGLPTGRTSTIDVLSAERTLGAALELGDPMAEGANTPNQEVRLQPVGSLSGRLLDDEGKPLRNGTLHLYRFTKDPEDSHRGFTVTVATLDGVDDAGVYRFDQLVPGATYSVDAEAGGHASAGSANAKIKSDQRARLDDFRLPRTDQVVAGIVVDSQGKPLPDVSVGYYRQPTNVVLYAPAGAAWFQETDAAGRFRLHGLPRGPLRLMAYRRAEGSRQSIDSPKYVDVRPGQSEVRIELWDTNDRLRGIE